MKSKKFDLQWQSMALGMVLCVLLALAVFLTSRPASAQVGGRERMMQRAANMNDVWDKTNILEEKINAMQDQINRIEQKINAEMEEQHQILKLVRTLDKELPRR